MSNEVLENIKSRRSVRTYTEQQVSAGDLNLILEAAAYAPSGMNFQTWHFTAIQDAAVLSSPASASPKITVCTAVLPWAMPLRTLP